MKFAVLGGLVLAFIGLQLFQPEAPRHVLPGEGTMSDHVAVPDEVERILRAACYDCHSGETRWPWYSRVAPLSWLIAGDVQHGLSNLDFSRWSTNPELEPTPVQRLRWICQDIRKGSMPPRLYRLAHPEARLEEDKKDLICSWTDRALRAIRTDSGASADRVEWHVELGSSGSGADRLPPNGGRGCRGVVERSWC